MEYDSVGNVKGETDANSNIRVFLYDRRNLVIKDSRPLAAITDHTYDVMGDRTETVDPEGRRTTWTYDERRRQLSETNGAGETTTFTYDDNGNRTRLERPNQNAWTFTFDAANRLTEVLDPDNATTFYDYDSVGNRTSETDANGQVTTHTYDGLNRLTRTAYSNLLTPTGDDLQHIDYAYDPTDNLLDATETYSGDTGSRVTTRSYDDFNRVLTVTDPEGHIITHNYDPVGNRLTLTAPGRVTRYRYDELNRVESVTTPQGVTEYDYDRSSRLTETKYPTGTQKNGDGFIFPQGNNLHAALVGTESSYPTSFDLFCGNFEAGYTPTEAKGGAWGFITGRLEVGGLIQDPFEGCWEQSGDERYDADRTDCIQDNPMAYKGKGRYEALVTTNPVPGFNHVSVVAYKTQAEFDTRSEGGKALAVEKLEGVVGVEFEIKDLVSLGVPASQRTDVIHLDDQSETPYYVQVPYTISPLAYRAHSVHIDFFEELEDGVQEPEDDKVLRYTWIGSERRGEGNVLIPRTTPFDASKILTAQVVLNRGLAIEVRSEFLPVPILAKLIRQAPQQLYVAHHLDLVNE